MAAIPKDSGRDKQNIPADLPKPHKPDLGRTVITLAEDVQKVMASLYDHQKSLDGTSNPSFVDVRRGLKDQWETLRSYLQRCHGFGADVLTLKDALRSPNEGDLIEFLDDMATSAKELRQWSEELKDIDMSSAFMEENLSGESANAGKFSPTKGKRSENLKIWQRMKHKRGKTYLATPRTKPNTEIYEAMLRIESHIEMIFQFWDNTSKGCSYLLEELKNGARRMTNAEAEQTIHNWKGYQEAIMKAIASIAKTCDAILVEAEGAPTIGLVTQAPVAGEGNGNGKKRRFGLGPKSLGSKGRLRRTRNADAYIG